SITMFFAPVSRRIWAAPAMWSKCDWLLTRFLYPPTAPVLYARANLRRRRFEAGVDADVPGGCGDEVCRQLLAADK
ncbi:MAG TPA: hypothetical protein VK993_05335, partial [Chthoniobacterales bacterium]|nr:hypothetical protein [Chthoniobacterales bacterium]